MSSLLSSNFMLRDLAAMSAAFVALSLFVLVPGYTIGWFTGVLHFRRRTLSARLLLSVVLSISLCPFLSYLAGRWISMQAVWALYAALWIGFLVSLGIELRRRVVLSLSPGSKLLWGLAGLWVVLGLFSLVDMQLGDRLYFPTVAYDYSVRTAFTSAITRTGFPPVNPFYYPGQPVFLRYHYFWMIPSSLTVHIAGGALSARQALCASTIWCGLGLMSLIPLYLRFFAHKGAADLKRRFLIGIGLLAVTGLDLLPIVFYRVMYGATLPSIEWWNEPVMAWVHAVLWVPHHVIGLICCFTGMLVLWYELESPRFRRVAPAAVMSAIAFSSALGSSIYITLAFAVCLAVWTLIALLKARLGEFAALSACGLLTLAFSIPYLLDLRGEGGGGGGGGSLLVFGIRHFTPVRLYLKAFEVTPGWRWTLSDLLFLPLSYALEFGFYLAAARWRWKLYRKGGLAFGRSEQFALTVAAASLVLCTTIRSSVITNNDLGWRGLLVTQFVLLLWGVDLITAKLDSGWRLADRWDELLTWLLILGFAGSVWEVTMQRVFPVLNDRGISPRFEWLSLDRQLGKRTYALRQTYEQLGRTLPPGVVVQHNPEVVLNDLFYGLYADRQAVAEGKGCGAVFGGNPKPCAGIYPSLNTVFKASEKPGPDKVSAACRSLSIPYLLVKDQDPAWKDKAGWVWSSHPVLANDFVRVFRCADLAARPGAP